MLLKEYTEKQKLTNNIAYILRKCGCPKHVKMYEEYEEILQKLVGVIYLSVSIAVSLTDLHYTFNCMKIFWAINIIAERVFLY